MKKVIFLLSIFFMCLNSVLAKEQVKFSSCIDGDTIKVIKDNETYTVRLLAIDAPEYSPKQVDYYGKEASDYTCQKVTNAKKLFLEYDPKSDEFDKYGRLLAWVFVDDILLEEELVEKGYAKVAYLYADYKYASILKKKQELAVSKNIGLWSSEEEAIINNHDDISYENIEIIIIGAILLIISLVGGKALNKKSKVKSKKNKISQKG